MKAAACDYDAEDCTEKQKEWDKVYQKHRKGHHNQMLLCHPVLNLDMDRRIPDPLHAVCLNLGRYPHTSLAHTDRPHASHCVTR